jgi:hypothetical protein
MSESIQTRTTDEESGDYRVYAAATVGGSQPVKGLAIHRDVTGRLDPNDYVEVTFSGDGAIPLEPDKATSATVRFASANDPSVRHVYVSPSFLQEFETFSFDGSDTDLDDVPDLALDGIAPSSEEEYEQDKEERGSAEEAADALLGSQSDGSDSDESDESEEAEVSDEAVGLVD